MRYNKRQARVSTPRQPDHFANVGNEMTIKIIKLSKNAVNLTGKTFGRIVAVAPVGITDDKKVIWLCVCHCGTVFTRQAYVLNRHDMSSCGCINASLVHGLHDSREYRIWKGMVQRCTNEKRKRYADYGGRGIAICDAWRQSFAAFYADMGDSPVGTSLDRIDNDGPYNPSNCRWATRDEQSGNRRTQYKTSRLVTFEGRTFSIGEWAKLTGINYYTLSDRLDRGWPIDRAFHTPARLHAPPPPDLWGG